eukprot:GEMP01055931.1.p1 GENE.GEMP01055931.1~~GEMP01055931.1.p1  ORF type:complete len:151 (+),score=29.91 GEMP01055931.1:44-496(+)
MRAADVMRARRDEVTTTTFLGDVYLRTGSFVPFEGELDIHKKRELDSPHVQGWRTYGAWWQSTQPRRGDPHPGNKPQDDLKYIVESSPCWPFGKGICHLQGVESKSEKFSLNKRIVPRVNPHKQYSVRETPFLNAGRLSYGMYMRDQEQL